MPRFDITVAKGDLYLVTQITYITSDYSLMLSPLGALRPQVLHFKHCICGCDVSKT